MRRYWLTKEERQKFADYCEVEVDTYLQMVKQMQIASMPAMIIKREQTLLAAFKLVGKMLRDQEEITL